MIQFQAPHLLLCHLNKSNLEILGGFWSGSSKFPCVFLKFVWKQWNEGSREDQAFVENCRPCRFAGWSSLVFTVETLESQNTQTLSAYTGFWRHISYFIKNKNLNEIILLFYWSSINYYSIMGTFFFKMNHSLSTSIVTLLLPFFIQILIKYVYLNFIENHKTIIKAKIIWFQTLLR